MSNNRSTIARRQFLKGATGVLGTGLLGTSSFAKSLLLPSKTVSVYFWSGETWIKADQVAATGTLQQVRVTVRSINPNAAFRAIDAIFSVPSGRVAKQFPFRAWTTGGGSARFTMPVSSGSIELVVTRNDDRATQSAVRLSVDGLHGNKLAEGTYAIVDSQTSVSDLDPTVPEAFTSACFLLVVERI